MGWCTTSDRDRFAAAAGGYLRSRAAENTMLLSAAATVGSGRAAQVVGQPSGPRPAGGAAAGDTEVLYGWWEPPDGSGPRGAFLHDPAVPLLIAGRTPEMAAALAGTLAKMGRHVSGVDAPVEAADAFAAAWSQRSRASIRVHRHCRVYRLTAAAAAAGARPASARPASARRASARSAIPAPGRRRSRRARPALRPVTAADRGLLIDLLVAYGIEAGERIASPPEMADDLISYGGAVLWEVPQRTSRIKEAAHYLVSPQHRDAAQQQAGAGPAAGGDGGGRPSGRGDGADQHRLHDARAPPQRPRGRGDARGQPGRPGRHGAGQRGRNRQPRSC